MKVIKYGMRFFCLSTLAYLTACGGGSSGGSGNVQSNTDLPNGVTTKNCPTDAVLQTDMIKLVNQARNQARTCGGKSYPAVASVTWNASLEAAAKTHTYDMAEHTFFSHTGSDGSRMTDRVARTGYQYGSINENIAAAYKATPAKVVDMWLESSGHCANIMSESVTEVGVACADKQGDEPYTYWTQVFATQRQ